MLSLNSAMTIHEMYNNRKVRHELQTFKKKDKEKTILYLL